MNIFDRVQVFKPKKSVFDLSHNRYGTCRMGQLVPVYVGDVVPGDVFEISEEVLVRTTPLATPCMSEIDVYMHWWFVPMRLVFDDWEDWFSPDESEYDTPTITFPYINIDTGLGVTSRNENSLMAHMGVAGGALATGTPFTINPLPFRAYQLIWNEWYRDQDLQTEATIDTSDGLGTDRSTILNFKNRCWRRDSFTSARPTTQKGGDVELPITGDATVVLDSTSTHQKIVKSDKTSKATAGDIHIYDAGSYTTMEDTAGTPNDIWIDPNSTLKADLSTASSTTIEELRRALVLQRWLERNMRGGTRYKESIMMHYGEVPQDARLDRPEFIHGSVQPLSISEVQQTSETNTTPQGTLAGRALSYGSASPSRKKFYEHGIVLGLFSTMPRPVYFEGMKKIYKKDDRFEYLIPLFSRLGEQAVYKYELYNDAVEANMGDVFGYQRRYGEYCHENDYATGEFQNTMKNWSLAREFGSAPTLNSDFVECQEDSASNHRIFADTATANDKIIFKIRNRIKALRPLPYFDNPL
jgi:hypothetical protein